MKTQDNINPALAELLAPDQPPVIEIAPGLTAEEMRAVYFNRDALKEPPYKLYRMTEGGYRHYYRFVDGEVVLYPSVTTLLRQTMPTSPFLIQWMVKNGEAATEKRDMAAAYGTFMHIQYERLVITRTYDLDKAKEALREYLDKENIPDTYYWEWLPRIRKDVLAFAQFLKDYQVRPLAIEISLVHPEYRFAGCIDMPCEMNDKKGETFRAIIDFKSGRNGFYEDYELQLGLYRMMWNETFPEQPVERIFNFAPKDWRKSPTYDLKEQTASPNLAKLPHLLALAAIEDEKRETNVIYCEGVINLDDEDDLTAHYHSVTLADLIKTRQKKAEEAAVNPTDGGDLFADATHSAK